MPFLGGSCVLNRSINRGMPADVQVVALMAQGVELGVEPASPGVKLGDQLHKPLSYQPATHARRFEDHDMGTRALDLARWLAGGADVLMGYETNVAERAPSDACGSRLRSIFFCGRPCQLF